MKNNYTLRKMTGTFLLVLFTLGLQKVSGQEKISDFEGLLKTYWNGSDLSGGFTSGNAYFVNEYDTSWGGYWSGGFAASNMNDSTTAGYTNMYSARTASAYKSCNYALGKDGAMIKLSGSAMGSSVTGFYVTNTTYAALSMKNGDSFAKKFGGTTGDDPDWFKLSITGFLNGSALSDTIHFYLADYRFTDNSKDDIVEDWRWVDLSSLGNVDSVSFHLGSSDVGTWGMNTPAYFAIDDFGAAQAASDFESLLKTYWNGSDLSGGFIDDDVYFVNKYDTAWGGYWSGGFAVSNMNDSTTASYTNMYSARTASAYMGCNYAVGKDGAMVKRIGTTMGSYFAGLYVTNTTYAALSMENGDSFAKKFGGTTGDDPDWFKLSITGYYNGTSISDTVHFYLADYRFTDNSQDYIVEDWRWISLSSLGPVDSVTFHLSSSDVGTWGINTPAFFAIDYFITDLTLSLNDKKENGISSFNTYPNPVKDILAIDLNDSVDKELIISIYDVTGKLIRTENGYNNRTAMNVSALTNGIYIISVQKENEIIYKKFIKQ